MSTSHIPPRIVPSFGDGMWTNPPERCWQADGALQVAARAGSDFWRDPRNDAVSDDGHLLGFSGSGDISCEVKAGGAYSAEFDQSGLMLRFDAAHWVKVGLDLIDGSLRIATVVTSGYSDSSLRPFEGSVCWFRLSRVGRAVTIEYRAADDEAYEMIRLAPAPATGPFLLGPMCCAPSRAGFVATFSDLSFGPPSPGSAI